LGRIRKHPPVKLITGFIFKRERAFQKARAILESSFGKTDFQSCLLPFNHTDYYQQEMGEDLKRAFVSFKKLIHPVTLPKIKITTNRIERSLSTGLKRAVNIDPGYLDLSKLVLASTKDYGHRLYADKGIFLEVTLFYQDKTFKPRDWTYPDYRSQEYIGIFNQIREIYVRQIELKTQSAKRKTET